MTEITQILKQMSAGERQEAGLLLSLIYDELRQLAAAKLAGEQGYQTLQATALVHEAYLRLVHDSNDSAAHESRWEGRGHFFAAAAEAMRRILVESARRRNSLKRGGDLNRVEMIDSRIAAPEVARDIESLSDALDEFEIVDPQAGELVKLRCFAGLTLDEAAGVLQVSRRTADRLWAYARAWLKDRISED